MRVRNVVTVSRSQNGRVERPASAPPEAEGRVREQVRRKPGFFQHGTAEGRRRAEELSDASGFESKRGGDVGPLHGAGMLFANDWLVFK